MGAYPIQAIVIPVVGLVFFVGMFVYRKRALAGMDEQYANYRAGEMAQRLGLHLVKGDPQFNLFIQQANAAVARGPSDKNALHVELLMRGTPHGKPLEFSYLNRVEQKSGFSEVTRTTWFECRLTATAAQAFPPFEVISRKAPLGPINTKQGLPAAPTGVPQIDAVYSVSTHEPGMAQLMAEVLPAFAVFQSAGIHLVGDGQRVSFYMERDKAPLLPSTLYYAEQMSQLLSHVAQRVGG